MDLKVNTMDGMGIKLPGFNLNEEELYHTIKKAIKNGEFMTFQAPNKIMIINPNAI